MKTLLAFILSLPLLAFAGGHLAKEHGGAPAEHGGAPADHDQPTMGSTAGERPDGAPAMEHPAGHDEPAMEHPAGHDGPTMGSDAGERPAGAPVMDD